MHRPRKKGRGAPPAAPDQAWRQNHAHADARGRPLGIAPPATPPHFGTATPGSWPRIQCGWPGRRPPRSPSLPPSAPVIPPFACRHCAARHDRPPCQRRFSRQATRLNPTRTARRSPAPPPRGLPTGQATRISGTTHRQPQAIAAGAMQAGLQPIYCRNAGIGRMAEDPPKERRRRRLGGNIEKAATESDAGSQE